MSEKESVKVVVRCRPFSEKEKQANYSSIVEINHASASVSIKDPKSLQVKNSSNGASSDPPKTFVFDSVFGMDSTQIQVYNTTARPIVDSVLNGYNGTIFAYGQTGTGKTFSMEGIRDVPELRGIIPNAFEQIFSQIKCAEEGVKFLVRATYLEIYNEEIRDLLNQSKKLDLKERSDTGVYVKDLKSVIIKDVAEMDKLMEFGNKSRSTGATLMNDKSSRSHSIFTVTVERSEVGMDGQEHIRVGKLNLVDLAGSERQGKTGATGDRLKEATKINLSLSALGNVISSLVDAKSSHIPYRDSKLTRLLQDSLGGNARTLMIATMSPASYNYEESLSSLRYANRAKNIKNKPKINEDPKDTMLREFEEEIKKLRQQLDAEGGELEEIEEVEEVEESEEGSSGEEDHGTPGINKKKSTKSKKKLVKKISESELARMQNLVEEEKKTILASVDIEEKEKQKLFSDLEKRASELEKEKQARNELASKLSQLEEKLLIGGVSVLDKEEKQRMELAIQEEKLEAKKREERELTRQLEENEETNLQIEEHYASLQEEATAKTKKLKKLWTLLTKTKSEVKDSQQEHQRERENLLETIRGITRELKYQIFTINQFIPPEYVKIIESSAHYDEGSDNWKVSQIAHAGNNIKGKRSLVTGQLVGSNKKERKNKNVKEDEENEWNPMCVFPDVYLSYDVPLSVSPKKKAPIVKEMSSKSGKRPPSRQQQNKSVGNLNEGGEPVDLAPPVARGKVQKPKRYA